MTEKIKTGGPAFPNVPSDIQYETWDEGMTLRDYFAAKAMVAILSGRLANGNHFSSDVNSDWLAKSAGIVADAMIKERGNCA